MKLNAKNASCTFATKIEIQIPHCTTTSQRQMHTASEKSLCQLQLAATLTYINQFYFVYDMQNTISNLVIFMPTLSKKNLLHSTSIMYFLQEIPSGSEKSQFITADVQNDGCIHATVLSADLNSFVNKALSDTCPSITEALLQPSCHRDECLVHKVLQQSQSWYS